MVGIGLVVGNVIGVGVLTNTGYMAVHLGPRAILLGWLVGGVLAMAGPRVAAAMAAEGFLPPALAGRRGQPPVWSVLLQSALALGLLATNSFEALLRSVGAVLTLASALTVTLVLRLRFGRTPFPRPSPVVVAAAIVFLAGSVWMLWYTLTDDPRALLWLAVVTVAAAIAYADMVRRRNAG